jgi:hypothetical protein
LAVVVVVVIPAVVERGVM